MSFRKTLHELATQRHVTSTELARATGISKSVLHRFFVEDIANPTLETLTKLANFFEITLDQLVGREGTRKEDVLIPLIRWEDVKNWQDQTVPPIKNISLTVDDKQLFKRLFAVCLNDSSMEPLFLRETILIFNPSLPIKDRNFILYLNEGESLPCFKQFINNGNKKLVKSLHPDLANQLDSLAESTQITGVLVACINDHLY